MIKKFRGYFSLSKKEFNGLIVLIILIAFTLFIPVLYKLFRKSETVVSITNLAPAIAKIESAPNYKKSYKKFEERKAEILFNFNPNNLPEAQWLKLGLSPKQVKIIHNYEAKGGKFYKKEDLQKIYSISQSKYQELLPYITFPEKNNYQPYSKYPDKVEKATVNKPLVEINGADSARLTEISGIGPSFASRIIKYRNRLGGFVNNRQLLEVYGFDSLKFNQVKSQITINQLIVKKINVNNADFNAMKAFPYLTYKQMNAIINYRKQHGNYSKIADLKNIVILNDQIINKIEPYLEF